MSEIVEALRLQDYYAAAALIMTMVIQVLRKAPGLKELFWERIPDGARWLVPLAGGAVTGFVGAFADGLAWPAALLAAVGGALAIGLSSMGLATALRESPIPWEGSTGTKSRKEGVMLLALVVGLTAVPSCASWKPAARTVDNAAEIVCSLFFSERQSISVEDAARAFCKTRDQIRPFLDEILAAKQRAGAVAVSRSPKQ